MVGTSIFETHYKTKIVLISFFVTTIGWWVWNFFLCGVYARENPIYKVRDGFTKTFGPDPLWWATLFGVLAVMGLMEMVLKIVKRRLVGFGLYNIESWTFWKRKSETRRPQAISCSATPSKIGVYVGVGVFAPTLFHALP